MKRIMIAAALVLAAAVQLAAADEKTAGQAAPGAAGICTGADGKACTDQQAIAMGAYAGKRRHQVITVTLAKGGALLCDRTPCPPDVLKDLSEAAGTMGLKVTSAAQPASSRSNTQHN